MKFLRNEEGQSIIEFAVLLPLIILIALAPVDFFRYAMMRMNINSATVEALNQITGEDVKNGTAEAVIAAEVARTYADTLPAIRIAEFSLGLPVKAEYDYYVYSSDKKNETEFPDRFERRPSNYTYQKAVLTLSCEADPLTFYGRIFFGAHWTVKSDAVSKDIFVDGYQKE